MLNQSPDESPFQTAAVVGAGLMGRRLAGVLASGGLDVRLTDVRPDLLEEAAKVANQLASDTSRVDSPGRVTAHPDLGAAVHDADFVTEAIIEDLPTKQQLFAHLADLAPGAVLASNSSVLPVTDIASRLPADARRRAVGTHWWNPPDLIPIVEVIQGADTDPDVVTAVMALMQRLRKTPVKVLKDTPGFVGNRLQHALWREAIALVEEGIADAETVDLVVRNTIGLRLAHMGPIENADYVGLELTRAIHQAVFPALSRATEPSRLLDQLIGAGHSGAAAGRGFMEWPSGRREDAARELADHVLRNLMTTSANTAAAADSSNRREPK